MLINTHRVAGHEQDTSAATGTESSGNVGQHGELRARLAAANKMLADMASAGSAVAAIGRALLTLTEAQRAAIFLRSPTGLVTCLWSHNLSDEYVRELVTPENTNPWMHILRHAELTCMDLPKTKRQTTPTPWFLPDVLKVSADQTHLADRITREGLRSACTWPITRAGRVIAALVYGYGSPHVYSPHEQGVMSAFASQVAAVVQDPGAPIAQAQSTMNAWAGAGASTDTPARLGVNTAGPAPVQRDATRPLVADEHRTSEGERARGEIDAARAQTSTAQQQLEAEKARLAADRTSLEADSRRLAQAHAEVAAETQRLSEARGALTADTARVADIRAELTVEAARLAETRDHLNAERSQLADLQANLDAAEAALSRDRQSLESEQARQELEIARAQMRAAEPAETDLTLNEPRRLADTRRAVEEEHARLVAIQRDNEAREARLAEAQRQLEDERAQLGVAHKTEKAELAAERASLQAEHQRLADAQATLTAEKEHLADAQRALETESEQLTQARQSLALEADQLAEARRNFEAERAQPAGPSAPKPAPGRRTYRMLVERAGAGATSDDDGQLAAVAGLLDAHVGRPKGHSQRLAGWAEAIARALAAPTPELQAVKRAALLHDIGMADVPETTLKKAGLTPDEQDLIDREAVVAHQMLEDVEGLRAAAAILQHRFEHWNGAGQPDGLKGEAIPLGARILAIVGAYGEMIAGRPGVPQLYYRDAIAAIKRGSGKRFDPKVVAVFAKVVTSG